MSFETYRAVHLYGEVLYNTSREFFSPLQGEEKYQTEGFKEIALIYGTAEASFRKTSALLNRIRHQEEGGTPFRTVRDATEHEGRLLQDHLKQKTRTIFQSNGFTSEGCPEEVVSDALAPNSSVVEEEAIAELVVQYDVLEEWKRAMLKNPVAYEDCETSVNISIDEVGAKKQKEQRETTSSDPPSKKNREYVQNTVIHVEKGGQSYIFNGAGVLCVLQLLRAFFLHNDLLSRKLLFFVDGHSLYSAVLQFFSWHKD